jgi:hypothetical protein
MDPAMTAAASHRVRVRPGRRFPLGATLGPGGTNFAVSSGVADGMLLCLFDGTGGPIGRWLTERVMNRVRRKGEAMGMSSSALVLTTIRCTSGRERNAVASMVGRDPR